MSTEKGGSKPASNKPEDQKSSGFKYEDDEIGSSHLLTKDGGVPSNEQLRQYAAKGSELFKSIKQQVKEEEKEEKNNQEKNNQQQNKK